MSLIELIDPGFIRDNIAAIKSQTDKLTFDVANRLAIQNPPNLDVALGTRASESTLIAVRDRLPSTLTSSGNFKVAVSEDSIGLAREPYASRRLWLESYQHVERWEWLASTNEAEKKREFYRMYHGRTKSVWKSEYAELNPENWSLPVYELGVNAKQTSPWNNAIHLRNSKGGTTLDEVYIAPKIFLKPPCILTFDGYFPAFTTTNYPTGTYISIGFEVNSGGYMGRIYEFTIQNDGTLFAKLRSWFGIDRDWLISDATPDIKSLITTEQWKAFTLVLLPNAFILYQDYTKIAELTLTEDFHAYITPYFANESTIIVSGVKIGQFQTYGAELFKIRRNVIDVSSISAGGFTETPVLVLPEKIALTISITYASAATAGVRVYILACNRDGTVIDSENTTDAFAYFDPSFSAGATRTRTVNIDMLPKYAKIRVRNLDSARATGACRVWIHEVF